jgi:hypothetical protein
MIRLSARQIFKANILRCRVEAETSPSQRCKIFNFDHIIKIFVDAKGEGRHKV